MVMPGRYYFVPIFPQSFQFLLPIGRKRFRPAYGLGRGDSFDEDSAPLICAYLSIIGNPSPNRFDYLFIPFQLSQHNEINPKEIGECDLTQNAGDIIHCAGMATVSACSFDYEW